MCAYVDWPKKHIIYIFVYGQNVCKLAETFVKLFKWLQNKH